MRGVLLASNPVDRVYYKGASSMTLALQSLLHQIKNLLKTWVNTPYICPHKPSAKVFVWLALPADLKIEAASPLHTPCDRLAMHAAVISAATEQHAYQQTVPKNSAWLMAPHMLLISAPFALSAA